MYIWRQSANALSIPGANWTKSRGSVDTATQSPYFQVLLEVVVILVAQRTSPGVNHIRHSQVRRHEVVEAENRIHLQGARAGIAPVVAPARKARRGLACAVAALLPRGELLVDEQVVHEECRVLGRGPDVSHNGTDAVVAGSVGSVRNRSQQSVSQRLRLG